MTKVLRTVPMSILHELPVTPKEVSIEQLRMIDGN